MGVKGANAGAKHYAWKGGKREMHGRIVIYAPDNPRANPRTKWVYEHILVAERAVGHLLPRSVVVHHVDENPLNNRNDNLCVLQSRGEHMRLHRRLRVLRAGGNPWTDYLCSGCGQLKKADAFPSSYNGADLGSTCRECCRQYQQRLRDRRSA